MPPRPPSIEPSQADLAAEIRKLRKRGKSMHLMVVFLLMLIPLSWVMVQVIGLFAR